MMAYDYIHMRDTLCRPLGMYFYILCTTSTSHSNTFREQNKTMHLCGIVHTLCGVACHDMVEVQYNA